MVEHYWYLIEADLVPSIPFFLYGGSHPFFHKLNSFFAGGFLLVLRDTQPLAKIMMKIKKSEPLLPDFNLAGGNFCLLQILEELRFWESEQALQQLLIELFCFLLSALLKLFWFCLKKGISLKSITCLHSQFTFLFVLVYCLQLGHRQNLSLRLIFLSARVAADQGNGSAIGIQSRGTVSELVDLVFFHLLCWLGLRSALFWLYGEPIEVYFGKLPAAAHLI